MGYDPADVIIGIVGSQFLYKGMWLGHAMLKDRTEQSHGTWEDVYKNAKKADRLKNDLHERDEGELERTGQPLCIYEPYFGEGSWPFLHQRSLYRGVGLSGKGRRSGRDDIDAHSRLPLLNNGYYRDLLGEHGAFFAITNRIDRLHKNAWIGFQSWRATARKASLSRTAENALLDAIQSKKYGDALYFWVRMDMDSRNPLKKDFWSFCDAINAGNCKFAFSEAMRRMYGIKDDMDSLPPMPVYGDTWSVMHSWALPSRSFLEFVMFSRMFVDALDAQMYDEHHSTGHCSLSLSKVICSNTLLVWFLAISYSWFNIFQIKLRFYRHICVSLFYFIWKHLEGNDFNCWFFEGTYFKILAFASRLGLMLRNQK